MTGPPIIKFFLMVTSYLVFFTCPWNNANVKVYIILIKILLNLIFESVLVGSLFLISIGFKIARSDISMFHFAVLLFIMLFNYLVIFVLIVFNEFYSIGTILYTTVNFILMIYLTLNFVNVLSKLKMFRRVAQNSRYPSQAIEIKIRIMKQAMIVVFIFFFLEVFYHGILAVFRIPSTREGDRNFFTCHEITDFIIVTCLLYIVRAREYIPYYGIINIDNEIGIDGDLEMQHLSKGEILSFNIDLLDKEEYSGENSDHEEIKPKDVVLILDPEGPNSEDQSFAKMTFPSKQLDILRKLGVGVCQDPSQIKEKQEL